MPRSNEEEAWPDSVGPPPTYMMAVVAAGSIGLDGRLVWACSTFYFFN